MPLWIAWILAAGLEFAKDHPVIATAIALVILLAFLSWRRFKAVPPVRIDRKVLWSYIGLFTRIVLRPRVT